MAQQSVVIAIVTKLSTAQSSPEVHVVSKCLPPIYIHQAAAFSSQPFSQTGEKMDHDLHKFNCHVCFAQSE